MLGSQAAFTRSFLQSHPVYPFELGGQRLLIVYDAEHGIVSLFDGPANDVVAEIAKTGIDSVEGLTRLPIHNGVFWMVWAHRFPETLVFS